MMNYIASSFESYIYMKPYVRRCFTETKYNVTFLLFSLQKLKTTESPATPKPPAELPRMRKGRIKVDRN